MAQLSWTWNQETQHLVHNVSNYDLRQGEAFCDWDS